MVNSVLKKFYLINESSIKIKVQEKINQHIVEIKENQSNSIKKIEEIIQSLLENNQIIDLFEYHSIYTSNHRLRLLKHLFESMKNTTNSNHVRNYLDFVPEKRNNLAHVTSERIGVFARKLLDKKGKTISAEDIKILRIKILEFREILENLLNTPAETD
jgi:hypothetical protein